ncbi:MAG: hypothetical protein RI959_2130 [Pseudomonadota bacterium]|jgi:uncharacterized membrane protein
MPGLLEGRISPRLRRVVQAGLYETFAVMFVTPVLAFGFGESTTSAFALSVTMSAIALCWNYLFNAVFEHWEKRQTVKGRSWRRRAVHGVLFEGGLALFLVPLMAYWLNTSLWVAFWADFGLLLFFLLYTVVFTWVFDKLFGLPQSARPAA